MDDSRSKVNVPDVLPTGVHANLDVENLLRQIVVYAGEGSAGRSSVQENTRTQEVVLAVSVDGMRYTLTRSHLEASRLQVNLSPREKEIVRLVAKGLPNKAISEVLDISPWTVATHLRRVFAKLGVTSRAEMVAHVLEESLLESHS